MLTYKQLLTLKSNTIKLFYYEKFSIGKMTMQDQIIKLLS